ncbi:MAG: tetratricopeptide repeat protein [Candidatus Obscuribacter sp.]|nr:tetratricopeptide repeat protein [Candidatus Obscuribacter sp.]
MRHAGIFSNSLMLALSVACIASRPALSAQTQPTENGTTKGDSDAAQATKKDSNSESVTHAMLRKGYDQLRKNDLEKAIPTLCNVVRADRDSPSARRYLAFALLQQGEGKAALSQLNALSLLQESTTFDIMLKAVALDMIGEHEKALEYFRETMERDPDSDYYRIKTIDQLLILFKYEEAMELATDGYNSTTDAKVAAIYRQRIGKISAIQRLTSKDPKDFVRQGQ